MMYKAVMNILIHIFCRHMYSFLLGKYPREELQGYRVCLSLAVVATTKLFPKVAVPFYSFSTNFENSSLSTFSSTPGIICVFNFSYSSGCEVISHGFDVHFPNA